MQTVSRVLWQVINDEARGILLWQLAFINVNEDCRKALLTVCNPHACDVADMVRACQNVGTAACNTKFLAAALAMHFYVSDIWVGGCFKYASMDYFKKDCHQQGDGIKIPHRDCPSVEKGRIGLLTAAPSTL